jgi:hypothetical protein
MPMSILRVRAGGHVHVHAARPCRWYMSMFMSMLHIYVQATCHAACPCSGYMSMLLSLSMLNTHVHAAYPCLHPVCLWCIFMLRAYAARPCCAFMLHVLAACPCCVSMLHDPVACPCSLSTLQVNADCKGCLSMLHVIKGHNVQKSYTPRDVPDKGHNEQGT